MAFIIKKSDHKFQVELTLNELTEVSSAKQSSSPRFGSADGGSFSDHSSKRKEVANHAVKYDEKFFSLQNERNSNTGVLESCIKCRVSGRRKGGKNRKIGFVDVDQIEYAGAGPSTQRYILQAYDQHHRLDNSSVQLTLNITPQGRGDPVFHKTINTTAADLPGEEERSASLSVITGIL